MGMKKKMLSATLCAVMVGSLAAPAFTVQAADADLHDPEKFFSPHDCTCQPVCESEK